MMHNFKYVFLSAVAGITTVAYSGGCVNDAMNIWQLSQCIACSVGAYFELTQNNYAAGINAPGHYKLCGDIDGGGNTDLNINASDVILDLGDYTISNMGSVRVNDGFNNIVIRNGTISNTSNCCALVSTGGGHQNVLVENLIIDTIVPVANVGTAFVAGAPLKGIVVRNITVYNGSPTNFFVTNLFGSSSDITFENIQCIGTNSAFTVIPSNPSAVFHVNQCNNLALHNIALIDQWQELNGMLLNLCSDIEIDGITITSRLATPASTTRALDMTSCFNGVVKNLLFDGGTNRVYTYGIITDTNSGALTIDQASIMFMSGDGFTLASGAGICENCVTEFNNGTGFVIGGTGTENTFSQCHSNNNTLGFNIGGGKNRFVQCEGSYNQGDGFQLQAGASRCLFEECVANSNRPHGFNISASDSSFNACTANYNEADGFFVDGVQDCFITDSAAHQNGAYGIFVVGVNATGNLDASCTLNNSATMFVVTGDPGVRLINNIAFKNAGSDPFTGASQIVMTGTIHDTGIFACGNAVPYTTWVQPPIGIINGLNNSMLVPAYTSNAITCTFIGALGADCGGLVAAEIGNLISP